MNCQTLVNRGAFHRARSSADRACPAGCELIPVLTITVIIDKKIIGRRIGYVNYGLGSCSKRIPAAEGLHSNSISKIL